MAIFKTIAGHLLDWAGVVNVPAALTALEGLKGKAGQIIEIGGVDAQGGVTELVAVDKPGGGEDSGQNLTYGSGLKYEDGELSVDATDQMEQDNTLPMTSKGVYSVVGNIEALLATI